MTISIDIGNLCTHCGISTAFNSGNGLFVNRIPSNADGKLLLSGGDDVPVDVEIEGYMCINCQSVECDECGELTPFYEILDIPIPKLLCEGCLDKHNASSKVNNMNQYSHIKFSDTDEGDVHHCMRCKYTGDDWAEHDDFKNEDESNERLCPKCYAQSNFIASDEELRLHLERIA